MLPVVSGGSLEFNEISLNTAARSGGSLEFNGVSLNTAASTRVSGGSLEFNGVSLNNEWLVSGVPRNGAIPLLKSDPCAAFTTAHLANFKWVPLTSRGVPLALRGVSLTSNGSR